MATSAISLLEPDTFLRSCPSKSNVRSGARCNSVVQRFLSFSTDRFLVVQLFEFAVGPELTLA